jgi:hypothetical protein
MKLFTNKVSAGLFVGVIFSGLLFWAYGSYMAYSEKHGADQRAVQSCKETYAKKFQGVDVRFENVTVRVIREADLGRDLEVTGTALYVSKDSKTTKEPMDCKVSIE